MKPMKTAPGAKIIKIDWLKADAILLTTRDQVAQYKNANKIPDSIFTLNDWDCLNGMAGWAEMSGLPFFYVFIKKKTLSVIVHESVHLAEHLLRCKRIKPKSEQLAYMVEYIFNQIRNHIKSSDVA